MPLMRRPLVCALVLFSAPALAQKPWEARVDLPVPVPLEMPAVPTTNPFATPVVSPPVPVTTPLREKFAGAFTVLAAVYVTSDGGAARWVFTRLPWPGLAADVRPPLSELTFVPARAGGAAVPVWAPVAFDLKGRVQEGRVVKLEGSAPDPASPPSAEVAAVPTPDAHDLELPATPFEKVEQMATAKHIPRFRADGRTWRQGVRMLAEIGPEGRCRRVVFLAWPEGLRPWLLASMASWTFRPAMGKDGPVAAWVRLDGDIEVEVGSLASDSVRITREQVFPPAAAQPASGRPPGA